MQMGVYAGDDVIKRVKAMQARALSSTQACLPRCSLRSCDADATVRPCQPHIKVVLMDSGVERGLSQIADSLGLPAASDVAANSADWPFVD